VAAIPVGGDVYGSDLMSVTVRPATTADLPAMATSLARAFADDPVKLFLTGGKELPVKRTEPFFMVFGRMHLPNGLVYTTPGREGGALWAPPGRWKVPVTQIIKATPQFLRLYGWRFVPNLGVLSALEKAHPTEPHYYLEFLGTDPAYQGRGIGSALLQPVLDRCDDEGVGAYLESSKESNVPFYARHGFTVTRELEHQRNGPHQWLMWRDPR
jgi:ribosomal protein S18 acetylase RimI-like enzyme